MFFVSVFDLSPANLKDRPQPVVCFASSINQSACYNWRKKTIFIVLLSKSCILITESTFLMLSKMISFRDLLIDHQIELDNFLQNRLQFLLKCISRCDTYMINMIYSNKKEAIIKIAKNFSFVLSILIRNVFALVFMELETSSTYNNTFLHFW